MIALEVNQGIIPASTMAARVLKSPYVLSLAIRSPYLKAWLENPGVVLECIRVFGEPPGLVGLRHRLPVGGQGDPAVGHGLVGRCLAAAERGRGEEQAGLAHEH